jgi:hypothetical protein
MKSMQDYLEQDGNIGFNIAIYNRFSTIGDSSYASICGGFIDGVYQWASHNIDSTDEVANSKYTGWIIRFSSGSEGRVYIPSWVMDVKPRDWKHAKNLFNKYLQVKQ